MTTSFRDLKIHTLRIFSELDTRCDTSFRDTQKLMDSVRGALAPEGQQLGAWEAVELNYADRALEAGFPRVALIAAGKAMAVSQLAPNEYDFGFRAEHPKQPAPLTEKSAGNAGMATLREIIARSLLTEQKTAARKQHDDDEEDADTLRLAQQMLATRLLTRQHLEALALSQQNRAMAEELIGAQAEERDVTEIKTGEDRRTEEQTQSRMAGGYSIEGTSDENSPENARTIVLDLQKALAQKLKNKQDETATDLKRHQIQTADNLRDVQGQEAIDLIMSQQKTAITLVEKQTVQALQKKNDDSGSTNSKKQ